MAAGSANADELWFSFGGGPQPGSDQDNRTAGIDFSFYRHERSPRQHITVGVSYTYLGSDSRNHDSLYAISIYPQASFFPEPGTWITTVVPSRAKPFFYVRALGPSYISGNRLGERKQDHNFTFQAQVGAGASFKMRNESEAIVALSWKHFSNANLFDENDGIDFPLVLNIGVRF